MAIPRLQQGAIIAVAAIFALILLINVSSRYASNITAPAAIAGYIPSAYRGTGSTKNAFAVYLSPSSNAGLKPREFANEDFYYTGTRMLLYQLLHDPETRTDTSIPFVVLVSTDVPQDYRNRLEAEGAIVKEVEGISFDWIKPLRRRWAHVMDKLHVFELVEYDKVLLLDADVVVTQRLDAIFNDPAAQLAQNLGDSHRVHEDEAPQPSTYIMAANSVPNTTDHTYPSPRGDFLNAGFVLLKPSIEMFQHYMSVAAIEERFNGTVPEQCLWNYVHDRNGNMPWKQLDPDWVINMPNFNDYKHGIKALHDKYWRDSIKEQELRDVLLKSRWKMQGYFDAYHARR